MSANYTDLPEAPAIPGLRFRAFAGESDYPAMAALMNEIDASEGEENTVGWTVDWCRQMDAWVPDFDPPRDRLIAEIDGRMIAAGRMERRKEYSGDCIYSHSCSLHPQWRGKGIEYAFLCHGQRRVREIAQKHPDDRPRFFQSFGVHESNVELMRVLESDGYSAIRHAYHMVRPDLENIPDRRLPAGIEIRPVEESQLRKIWDAAIEAFQDHWGSAPPTESSFDIWRKNPEWNRELTRVAWSGDEVVGRVLIFNPFAHNRASKKQRAYTESICVGRRWRKQGVASALIALCLHAIKEAGFHEAALGVDTENLSGALRIYETMGYHAKQKYSTYRKTME